MRHFLPLPLLLLACAGGAKSDIDSAPVSPGTGSTTSVTTTGATTPTGTGSTTLAGATLVQSGPVACADPTARAGSWWRRTELPAQPHAVSRLSGGGMAINDFDGDGTQDIFIPGEASVQFWFQDVYGTWEDRALTALPQIPFTDASGASAADFDGDGDFDIYLTRELQPDVLLRNDGGVFVDITEAAGMDPTRAWRSMASSWADWDMDGDLDLSVAVYNRIQPSMFWLNNGDGTFTETAPLPVYADDGLTFQLTWQDLNGDGFPELFVANDHPGSGADCMLFSNQGGVLTEDPSVGYHPGWDGMGLAVADFNGDLVPDLAETTWRDISLLIGAVVPTAPTGLILIDSTAAFGLAKDWVAASQRFSWGIDTGDLDNDRDIDMAATWGHWEAGNFQIPEQPDSLWIWDAGQFTETVLTQDTGAGRALLMADLNGDGWLDITKRNLKDPTQIDIANCGPETWLTVRIQDVAGSLNRHGIGVTVLVENDGQTQIRWIDAGSRSMYSSGPPQVHFGLGQAAAAERIEIRWPDGRSAEFFDVGTRQHLTVQMPEP